MNLLQVTSKPPFPGKDGGCKAMAALTNGLILQGNEVQLLCIATQKHPFNIASFPPSLTEKTKSVFINTKPNFIKAVLAFILNKSYNITRFDSPKMHQLVKQSLQQNKFDAIILDSLYTTPYLPTILKNTTCPVIYRAHNIEYELWEAHAKTEKNIFKKLYLQHLAKRLKKYEINFLTEVTGIACISPENAIQIKNISKNKRVSYIPFSINDSLPKIATSKKLFFIGSFEWEPNIIGLKWFIKNVWGKIIDFDSEIEFHIAGKGMNRKEWEGKNIVCHGEVENAEKFIEPFFIMPVPLFNGSGVRIKIIEAMAAGKIIIATPKAAEGIPYTHQKNIFIAQSENEFINYIKYCILNPEVAISISLEAQKLAAEQYGNRKVMHDFITFINKLKEDE
ncbi:MAG: glycosyltransferase family 4 protein [Flavobacteriales bacterium]|nr:glycosyltransferase family 4 protein [Flavobacteriales bacterium]